jgi:hypothetical protein
MHYFGHRGVGSPLMLLRKLCLDVAHLVQPATLLGDAGAGLVGCRPQAASAIGDEQLRCAQSTFGKIGKETGPIGFALTRRFAYGQEVLVPRAISTDDDQKDAAFVVRARAQIHPVGQNIAPEDAIAGAASSRTSSTCSIRLAFECKYATTDAAASIASESLKGRCVLNCSGISDHPLSKMLSSGTPTSTPTAAISGSAFRLSSSVRICSLPAPI